LTLGFVNPDLRQNVFGGEERLAEEVSDMFLFWIGGYPFTDDEFGQLRSDFVNGIDREFEDGTVRNPGMIGWSRNGGARYGRPAPAIARGCDSQTAFVENNCLDWPSVARSVL
jgi:hypothetical protein